MFNPAGSSFTTCGFIRIVGATPCTQGLQFILCVLDVVIFETTVRVTHALCVPTEAHFPQARLRVWQSRELSILNHFSYGSSFDSSLAIAIEQG